MNWNDRDLRCYLFESVWTKWFNSKYLCRDVSQIDLTLKVTVQVTTKKKKKSKESVFWVIITLYRKLVELNMAKFWIDTLQILIPPFPIFFVWIFFKALQAKDSNIVQAQILLCVNEAEMRICLWTQTPL